MYRITLEIEELPEGPYLGTSPELPGLVVQGESVEQVLRLAPDVARDLIAVMVETGQPVAEMQQRSKPNLGCVPDAQD